MKIYSVQHRLAHPFSMYTEHLHSSASLVREIPIHEKFQAIWDRWMHQDSYKYNTI